MGKNEVILRRSRISNYLDEHETVGIDQPKIISEDLGIRYDTVKNDLRWLDGQVKSRLEGYNLYGFLKKTLQKRDRIHQIQNEAREIARSCEDPSIRLKAYQVELKAIHDEFDIESDGITLIQDELESRCGRQD